MLKRAWLLNDVTADLTHVTADRISWTRRKRRVNKRKPKEKPQYIRVKRSVYEDLLKPVVEMYICEVPHLFLNPNVNYIFRVHPTCIKCAEVT